MTAASRRPRIVVIGAGAAGLRAAERLREMSFDGDLVIVGAERHHPYHRPALSKQVLTGRRARPDLSLLTYVELGDCWRLDTRAEGLDPAAHTVLLRGAEPLRYDGLVIATGVQARGLAEAPMHDPRVHVLRSYDDALAIRATMRTSKGRVVVVGTGFTACEVASSARQLNRPVTIVGRSKTLLGNALGEKCGLAMNEFHRHNGTDLALGAMPTHWQRTADGVLVRLSDHQTVQASCVVVAIGSVYDTEWLRESGIAARHGIHCESTCFVSGVTDIVAAGDVATWPNVRFDPTPRSCQHWLNAVEMGEAAAENLLAGRSRARPFCPLPRFWSEQYGMRIQGIGRPGMAGSARPIPVAPKSAGGPLFGYFQGPRRVGVVAFDRPRDLLRLSLELDRELPAPAGAIGHGRPDRRTDIRLPSRARTSFAASPA